MKFKILYFLGLIVSNIFGYSVTFQLYVCDDYLEQDIYLQLWDPYQAPEQMTLKDGESNIYIATIEDLSGDIIYNFQISDIVETSGTRNETISSDIVLDIQYYNDVVCSTNNLPEEINIKFQINACRIQARLDSVFISGNFTNPPWEQYWALKQHDEDSDYWMLEDSVFFSANLPNQLEYKYIGKYTTNDNSEILEWEDNLPGNDYQGTDNIFSEFEEESVVPMYYLGTGPEGTPPFQSSDELQDIYFRVNMILQDIDSDYSPSVQLYQDSLGENILNPDSFASILIKEGESPFYSFHYQTSSLLGEVFYRFGFLDATNTTFNSLETNIRPFETNGETDTTLAWVYYNDIEPIGCEPLDTIEPLVFKINVSNAVSSLGFDEAEDFITVKWGFGNTQSTERTDTLFQYTSKRYKAEISTVCLDLSKGLYYQYYKNNSDREIFYNFNYNEDDITLAERRFIDIASIPADGQIFDVEDNIESGRRAPIFKNTNQIGQDVTVTYTLDLRPAYYQLLEGDILEDAQGELNMTLEDDIFEYGVWINGDASGGWNNPNCSIGSGDWGLCLYENEDKKMWDDGSHGDITPLDSIYTIEINYLSTNKIGQEFKFGIKGGDNEGGYGNNHIENINVSNPNIHSSWGSIDPVFYNAWDYDNEMPLSNEKILTYPKSFQLGKNYPNPFNPKTQFSVFVPEFSNVEIVIFDIQGKIIKHLVDQNLKKGKHWFTWDGTNDSHNTVSSGIYFYSLNVPNIRIANKMLYLK